MNAIARELCGNPLLRLLAAKTGDAVGGLLPPAR
jgi:hypothetical protein